MSDKAKNSDKKAPAKSSKLIALKDFRCQFDNVQVRIAEGDDVSKMDLPDWVITNLKTEKVLKG